MTQHVHPDLAVFNKLRGKRGLEDGFGSDLWQDNSGVFQIVLQRLPSEFESVFETLDEAFHSSWLKASVALSSKTERKSRYARSKF